MSTLRILRGAILATSAFAFTGCGGDGSDPTGEVALPTSSSLSAAGATASPVLVRLDEFKVTPSRVSVKAGSVRFMVLNQGTEMHEFVVVKTDLSADELPTNEDGSFDEEGEGVEVIDEIEDIEPHDLATLDVSLEAGHYIILCNRVEVEEDGEVESHFAMGMHADLQVM
jgi:uncharacterized cupredoxin-like copper-binding protein